MFFYRAPILFAKPLELSQGFTNPLEFHRVFMKPLGIFAKLILIHMKVGLSTWLFSTEFEIYFLKEIGNDPILILSIWGWCITFVCWFEHLTWFCLQIEPNPPFLLGAGVWQAWVFYAELIISFNSHLIVQTLGVLQNSHKNGMVLVESLVYFVKPSGSLRGFTKLLGFLQNLC